MATEILMPKPMMPLIMDGLKATGHLHCLWEMADPETFLRENASKIGAIATGGHIKVDGAYMSQFPNLKIVANFGVGYDTVDAAWAGQHGIIVSNTPDVLTEEVADTALGLLIMTMRELSQSERYLRAGLWASKGPYPLTHNTLRGKTVGILALGRIGKAIATRCEAFGLKIVYHGRNPQKDPVDENHLHRTSGCAGSVCRFSVSPDNSRTLPDHARYNPRCADSPPLDPPR